MYFRKVINILNTMLDQIGLPLSEKLRCILRLLISTFISPS